jgi:phosphoglycolate phosphatase-like HAD superfamily hydrolase
MSGRAAEVVTVGVTWGAFGRHELEEAGADVVIDRIEELPALLARFPARTA